MAALARVQVKRSSRVTRRPADEGAKLGRWLERIIARVAIEPNRVFPTDELLNHVPILVDGIADYLESGETAEHGSVPLDAEAMELGALRHAQKFDCSRSSTGHTPMQ